MCIVYTYNLILFWYVEVFNLSRGSFGAEPWHGAVTTPFQLSPVQ